MSTNHTDPLPQAISADIEALSGEKIVVTDYIIFVRGFDADGRTTTTWTQETSDNLILEGLLERGYRLAQMHIVEETL